MARLICSQCGQITGLPSNVLFAAVRCTKCYHIFSGNPEVRGAPGQPLSISNAPATPRTIEVPISRPQIPEVESQPPGQPNPPSPPRLTSPHTCHQCKQPFASPVGKAQTTIDCPACHNRTSVYAVHYRCIGCGILLESPSDQQGLQAQCPECARTFPVPRPPELPIAGGSQAETWFTFRCGNCFGPVVVATSAVGTHTVCPGCFFPVHVPNCGYRVGEAPPKSDPADSLSESNLIICSNCQAHVPSRSLTCPLCGTRTY